MKTPFKIGDIKIYEKRVKENETASFDSGEVHPFYATFALAKDAEWAGRLFVLEMKDEDEEGIGTFVNVEHRSPALVGDLVKISAVLTDLKGNSVICEFEAYVGDRLIAKGTTGQKIIKKSKLASLYQK